MLFTEIPPCTNYTAGIVLNDMCEFLLEGGHNVSCFYIHSPLEFNIPDDKKERINFKSAEKPFEYWGHKKYSFIQSLLGNNIKVRSHLKAIVDDVTAFVQQNSVDLIWVVVQGQSIIKLTRPISQNTGVPYVVQLWDPLIWWLTETKCDIFTRALVFREYKRVIKESECLIAASWAMAEGYQKKYKCKKSIPVIRGFETGRMNPTRSKDDGRYIIAMSGQMYAAEELKTLIGALRSLNWTINDKTVCLKLYGHEFNLELEEGDNVELLGWYKQAELLQELANADLLYCPYKFDTSFEEVAKFSFPSKLSTYLKTGVLVLFHGPEYSSPQKFLEENNAAYLCNSNNIHEVSQTLVNIDNDQQSSEIVTNGYEAFLSHLTLDKMKENFYKALGLG